MKKRTLFACGLAAALFAGCSSDDVTVDNGTIDPNAKSYLSLRISLPSTSGNSSRDTSTPGNQQNDVFNSGNADEYKVSTITLVCFDNSDNIVKIIDDISASWGGTTASGISTEAVLPVQEVTSSTKKVLVLLNRPTIASLTTGNSFTTFNTALTDLTTEDLTGASHDKFFMSNAPLSDGTNRTVLVNVVPQETKEAAMANAREVHVERATGKVTVTTDGGWTTPTGHFWTYQITADAGFKNDKIEIKNWKIDNYNTTTYPVRKYVDKAATWEGYTVNRNGQRFYGTNKYYKGNAYYASTAEESLKPKEARTYWAEDPNYDGKTGLETSPATLTDAASLDALKAPQYCLENTFEVNSMTAENTTRAIIKALYTPDGLDEGKTWFRLGNSSTAYSLSTLETKINTELGLAGENIVKLKTDYTFIADQQDFDAAMFKAAETGVNKEITPEQVTTLKNHLGQITAYLDGYCYYTVLIQHFGSYYTPWGSDPDAKSDWTDGGAYYKYTSANEANEDAYFLGRYGIVRNNWYQLELGTVSAPGSPKVPSVDGTPDDELKYYLSATVKIMDWAVRKQSVNL